jgi:LacI family transcriptional regulator
MSETSSAGHLPRMDDVARLAGVNKATVSRALKGDHRISAATREKVWKAAKVLGYHPDAVARGLSSKRSDMVAIVVRRLDSPWIGGVLCGVLRVLERQSVDVLLKEAAEENQAARIVREISSRRADGILWFGTAPDAAIFADGAIRRVTVGDCVSEGPCVVPAFEETVEMLTARFGGEPAYLAGAEPLMPGLSRVLSAECPNPKAVFSMVPRTELAGTSPSSAPRTPPGNAISSFAGRPSKSVRHPPGFS